MDRDLPEGVIDAEPAGGWESGDAADSETVAQNADAAGDTSLADAERADAADRGPHPDMPDVDDQPAADQFVASAEIQQGLDPDVLTDGQTDDE